MKATMIPGRHTSPGTTEPAFLYAVPASGLDADDDPGTLEALRRELAMTDERLRGAGPETCPTCRQENTVRRDKLADRVAGIKAQIAIRAECESGGV